MTQFLLYLESSGKFRKTFLCKVWRSIYIRKWKVSSFWDPLIKAFIKLSYNWILFEKLQISVIQPTKSRYSLYSHTAELTAFIITFFKLSMHIFERWLPWNGAISIKIYLISLFTPTYFAVATSCSELKLTQTFTVMHGKFSPWSHMVMK